MKKLLHALLWIVKSIAKGINYLRLIITNIIFLFIFIGIIALIGRSTPETENVVQTDSAPLYLDLSGQLVEKETLIDPMQALSNSLLEEEQIQEIPLYPLVETIKKAKDDPNITGLILNVNELEPAELAQLTYLGNALADFKQSKKPFYAYADNYSQAQYYLASFADTILLSKDGSVLLQGFGGYGLYYKDLLDHLEITPHIFRVGTYKSYVEPFIRNDMSSEVKKSTFAWLNQLWQGYLDQVSTNRQLEKNTLTPDEETLYSELKLENGDFAALCLKLGLVDRLVSRPEIEQILIDEFGSDDANDFNAIDYREYQHMLETTLFNENITSTTSAKIAVIVADGQIIDGAEKPGMVGGNTTAALLRDARFDENIKAVILRVNSPGGSAFASEMIREEIVALKEAGKPVVASLSGIAASGGYWISVSADKIIAQPNTITGSIGIFGMYASVENLLAKIGVHSDGVTTTPYAGISPVRPLSDKLAAIVQLNIENGYQKFIGLVSQYRNMSLQEADSVAQGQVWTGADARRLGLVDELGDFNAAIESAKTLANIEDAELDWMRKPLTPAQAIIKELSRNINVNAFMPISSNIESLIPAQLQQTLTNLQMLNDPKGQYSLCLNCVRIK